MTNTTNVVTMSSPSFEIMKTDSEQLQHMSRRYQMWEDFAKITGDHIETYTVPQYGDYPMDQLTEWDIENIKTSIKRYANRMGNNARGVEEDKRDMLKIAHYACTAYHKMCDTEKDYK